MDSFDYIYLKCFDGRHSGHGLKKSPKKVRVLSISRSYYLYIVVVNRTNDTLLALPSGTSKRCGVM